MAKKSHGELIAMFASAVGVEAAAAQYYLEIRNYDYAKALSKFHADRAADVLRQESQAKQKPYVPDYPDEYVNASLSACAMLCVLYACADRTDQ
jgi:hypothetical protein